MRIIRNYDVTSLYPSIMIEYGFLSRNVPEPALYTEAYHTRITAKEVGNILESDGLKLIINTTYGASLNQWNELYDPWSGRSVCITGQLMLTDLAMRYLMYVPNVEIIQINTDGIMISFDQDDDWLVKNINTNWSNYYRMGLEEEKIKTIYQKDVNNYVMITLDGKVKGKGGFIRAGVRDEFLGIDNNDFYIVSKALVDNLLDGTPIEETIRNETDILKFQMIAHASGKFTHVEMDNKILQKTNRIYASKDKSKGTIYKLSRKTNRLVKFANAPAHVVVDNENKLTVDDIDVDWYIKLAKRRLTQFLKK